MAAALWERFIGHRVLPKAALVVLAAVLVAGSALVRSERHDAHNLRVMGTMCAGVLPEGTVRGPRPETRTEYGAELAALSHDPAPEPELTSKSESKSGLGRKRYRQAVRADASRSGHRTLSRVTVAMAATSPAAARADGVLDAYLDASGCRAVKVLGKVRK
ncbi:hypothetical protein ACPEIF_11405 [Streptomyces sp. NPDC012600]|uniref:hypothetical protein n=1 Tax=Streptomyces sp. NPDC012600 TaxID=3415005 RepID=UPI003C2BED8B